MLWRDSGFCRCRCAPSVQFQVLWCGKSEDEAPPAAIQREGMCSAKESAFSVYARSNQLEIGSSQFGLIGSLDRSWSHISASVASCASTIFSGIPFFSQTPRSLTA